MPRTNNAVPPTTWARLVPCDRGVKHEFAKLATDYYVSARWATRVGITDILGNLFHHSIEMYLKAGLVETVPTDVLKNPRIFGHNINKLWKEFKNRKPSAIPRHFDQTIAALHAFEKIRYPNTVIYQGKEHADGKTSVIPWTGKVGPPKSAGQRPQHYETACDAIDDLVVVILELVPLNPRALATRFLQKDAHEVLLYRNPQAEKWKLPG